MVLNRNEGVESRGPMTKGQDRADNTKTASHDETFRPPRRVQFMIYVRLLTNVLFMLDVYVAVHGHVMVMAWHVMVVPAAI